MRGEQENTTAPIKKTVLLDVDDTTCYGDPYGQSQTPRLNTNLLAALKEGGVTDIYLFTHMGFNAETIRDRLWLIKKVYKGIKKIWALLDSPQPNFNEILAIANDRKGFRGASFAGFGLFLGSDSAKSLYKEIATVVDAYIRHQSPELNTLGLNV